jgi:hypothetical protein
MRTILVELHIPNHDSRWYTVDLPTVGEPDFYRVQTSWSWFRDRELKRAFPDVSGNLIRGLNWVEYARTKKYCSEHTTAPHETMTEHLDRICRPAQITRCDTVWQFYDSIGYNRITKKYNKNE